MATSSDLIAAQLLHDDILDIVKQGQILCQSAKGLSAEKSPVLCQQLPFLTLKIHDENTAILDFCRRSLIDDAIYQDENSSPLDVFVTDRKSRPDLIFPDVDASRIGLGMLIEQLEESGLCGCYESDYHSWQFMDVASKSGIQFLQKPDDIAPWEKSFPLRNFLHWAYAAQERRLIHAGSLGLANGDGVLLAGAGGAGKSGTTLAGVLQGLKSVGDDYVVMELADNQPRAFPVIRLMKQDPRGLERLGLNAENAEFGALNWQGKHEFDFAELVPGSRSRALQIKAILLPRITGQNQTSISPATRHETMLALLPNNLQQLPGQMKQCLNFLAQMVRILPGYHINLGTDQQEITDVIHDFLEKTLP